MSKKPILFCTQCGAPVERKIPEGDDQERYVCTACGEIFYENPLNIVGTLPVWEDQGSALPPSHRSEKRLLDAPCRTPGNEGDYKRRCG